MSRNKTIKLLHDLTLCSYKECRAALKRNKWDFVTSYIYLNGGIDINSVSDCIINAAENITQALAAACEGLAQVFAGVGESLRNLNKTTLFAADAARLEAIPRPDLLPAAAMREQFDLNTGETEEFTAPIVSFDGVIDDDGTIHGRYNNGETI